MNTKNLISATLIALGVTAAAAHACGEKTPANAAPGVKAGEKTLIAGMSGPAGVLAAGAGVALLVGRGKKSRKPAVVAPASATTSAFDYPSGDQW